MTDLQQMAASLARIEAQGRSTHHRLDELRDDLKDHVVHDDARFEKVNERITKGAVKQGWIVGIGVGAMGVLSYLKDHLTG
jgi:hypothetical protein